MAHRQGEYLLLKKLEKGLRYREALRAEAMEPYAFEKSTTDSKADKLGSKRWPTFRTAEEKNRRAWSRSKGLLAPKEAGPRTKEKAT